MASKGPLATALAILLLTTLPLAAAEWRHRDIWLKNEQGEAITPGRNATDPYSPRKTCGSCHGYATITAGYHFQQGFDEMRDGFDPQRPWILSPGRFGQGCVPGGFSGRVAAKNRPRPAQGELSTFDWIGAGTFGPDGKPLSHACSGTHPGGGPMEYGRRSDGRSDFSQTLVEGEAKSRSPRDGDYTSRATPDGRSQFRRTGVVEGDCLICHLPAYRLDRRNAELGRRNYRWAATAGAGLGRVDGAVFVAADPGTGADAEGPSRGSWNLSRSPAVHYDWGNTARFTGRGQFRGSQISKRVGSESCLQCHRQMDGRNTGTLHEAPYDAHVAAGLQCTDCHPLAGGNARQRLRHQIAKGFSSQGRVRDALDGSGMKGCVACHLEGQYRPTRPGMPREARNPSKVHREKFPQASFHFTLLACSACHATAQAGRAVYLRDLATGAENLYTADRLEKAPPLGDWGQPAAAPWRPWMVRQERVKGEGERYVPAVPVVSQWFGERQPEGGVRPIDLAAVRRAFLSVKGLSTVEVRNVRGDRERVSTVATERDMRLMIGALQRQGFADVVFVSDRIHALRGDKVTPLDAPPASAGPAFPAYDRNAAWFGERQESGQIQPIPLQDLLIAFRSLEGISRRETRDAKGRLQASPEIATGKDIRAAIAALTGMGFRDVVFIAGRLYELKQDKLRSAELPAGLKPAAGRGAGARWFGERQGDGSIRPIGAAAVRQALNGLQGLTLIEIRTERGAPLLAPTIAGEADIRAMLAALTKAGFKRVVMVGRRLHEWRDGRLVTTEFTRPDRESAFTIHHNVSPLEGKRTYGARGAPDGCLDCHGEKSPFFTTLKIRNVGRFLTEQYPAPKPPLAAPQMHDWGLQEVPAHE